ncbi:MAG: 50S ribosome-binding GTPase, partial [Propionibacteriaceae bacterium]|nr:50S ribosome-binding GTPase [Propionibacteriaceae bacterium]
MRSSRPSSDAAQTPLAARVKALGEAADLAAGRSTEAAVAEAKRVTRQVDRRLAFSGDSTVIAVAGPTGSGKSSLFNAISGTQLARSGVRRPTTDAAMAAYWGAQVPADLFRWLDIGQRHCVNSTDPRFDGLVLVDLPDHDSTQASHRVEVDRLVKLVDGIIWVLDPQKYADNTLHERYLRPLAPYAELMYIVLNQADRLSPDDLGAAVADLRKLLLADGLGKATLLTTSALTGQGIDDMRDVVAARVATKKAAAARLATDVTQAAKGLLGDVSRQRRRVVTDDAKAALLGALEEAAGLPQVVDGVAAATRQKGALATGWPLVSWINRLKPDPLRLLRGDAGAIRLQGMGGAVALAKVDAALRNLSADVTAGLTPGWAAAVQNAATEQRTALPADLDAALA